MNPNARQSIFQQSSGTASSAQKNHLPKDKVPLAPISGTQPTGLLPLASNGRASSAVMETRPHLPPLGEAPVISPESAHTRMHRPQSVHIRGNQIAPLGGDPTRTASNGERLGPADSAGGSLRGIQEEGQSRSQASTSDLDDGYRVAILSSHGTPQQRERRRSSLRNATPHPNALAAHAKAADERAAAEAEVESRYANKRKLKEFRRGSTIVRQKFERIEEAREAINANRCLLDFKSPFFRGWDLWTGFLLLYTATVTPYEVAFSQAVSVNALFFINRCVDLTFTADMIINFFLPYQSPTTGQYVMQHRLIVWNYLRSWFLLDLVSVVPFEMVELLANSDSIKDLKIMRLVRLLRLMKLLRLLRSARMFQRWEASLEIDYSLLDLQKFILSVLMCAHWLACGWRMLLGDVDEETMAANWVTNYSDSLDANNNAAVYLAALYWAVATLSTLGYGDVLPVTDAERGYVVFATIIGGSIYAYMVGAVCGLVASMNEHNTIFYKTMDNLNAFMREKHLPQFLKERCREYFRFRRSQGQKDSGNELLGMMSRQLRADVADCTYAMFFKDVSFFRNCPSDFYTELALHLDVEFFSSNEYIIRENDLAYKMYIVEHGMVGCNGTIVGTGNTFGTDMIGTTPDRRRSYTALTLSNSSLLTLSRDGLDSVLVHFSHIRSQLRKNVVRLRCCEAVLTYVRAVKRIAGLKYNTRSSITDGKYELDDAFDLSGFQASLVPMLLEHRLNAIIEESPAKYDKMCSAACIIQKNVRMYNCKTAYRVKLSIFYSQTPSQKALSQLLDKLDLTIYQHALVFEHHIDLKNIKRLTPDSLYLAVGMPMGHGIKLLDAIDGIPDIKSRISLHTNLPSFDRKHIRPSSRADQPIEEHPERADREGTSAPPLAVPPTSLGDAPSPVPSPELRKAPVEL